MIRQTLAAYWLPSVGIGPEGSMKQVYVPLTDVLKYRRADGSPQIDVVNVAAATFNPGPDFQQKPLLFDSTFLTAFKEGQVAQLQAAGVKVVLTITGKSDDSGSMGWGSLSGEQLEQFTSFAAQSVLGPLWLNLDGIDIDDEYPSYGSAIVPVVKALRQAMPGGKILSKALWNDDDYIKDLVGSLDYGAIMNYGDDAGYLEGRLRTYVEKYGFAPGNVMIGVNAGPGLNFDNVAFTSIPTAVALTAWHPPQGPKMGMMLWSFSQDIQQFTGNPQNQSDLTYPNGQDHSWQQAMIFAMESWPANVNVPD
jgi:hypothetical protein